ncbi:MAG: HlyD family efflux transporter periplasmic adaptor subunit [Verrucomicrobiae bacterium]|nr:HlyD family efflux transporter periplasmic adaptor subunit [Verrucomicrobiae bacterium]
MAHARILRISVPAGVFIAWMAGCGQRPPDDAIVMVGTVERDRLEMLAPITETLVELPVQEGQKVAAGALIARLDDARLKEEIAALQSTRDAEKARLDELEAGFRTEEIAQARAAHQAAVAKAELAAVEFQRAKTLATQTIEAQSRFDSAKASLDAAEAEKRRAAEALRLQETGYRGEQIRAQRAAVEAASARLREAQVRLGQLSIKAPCDCSVSTLPFRPGERVLQGVSVATLRAADRPFARVFVPERVKAIIKPGVEGVAKVDGVAREFKARVRTVASEASFTPFYALTERERERLVFAAKVDLIEPEASELPVGVPVTVRISTK